MPCVQYLAVSLPVLLRQSDSLTAVMAAGKALQAGSPGVTWVQTDLRITYMITYSLELVNIIRGGRDLGFGGGNGMDGVGGGRGGGSAHDYYMVSNFDI